jgi:hypothetical protein
MSEEVNEEEVVANPLEGVTMPYEMELTDPMRGKDGTVLKSVLEFVHYPNARMMRKMPINFINEVSSGGNSISMDVYIDLLAGMTGLPVAMIDSLSSIDFFNAQGLCLHFLSNGRQTGN